MEEGVKALERFVRLLGSSGIPSAKVGIAAALRFLHGELPEYPNPPTEGSFSFVSEKQRRWFFWALKNGLISVPYRITETLGRQWYEKVTTSGNTVTGLFGTATPYAQYVVGRDTQAAIHQNRWWVFEDLVDENIDEAYGIITEEFFADLASKF